MSSPMVERVGEIPLNADQGLHMEYEITGFPFDDDCDDQEDTRFRSQLDDLTVRHPELAQHLGSFPFRSGNRTRTHLPEHFGHTRFGDRPFGERFERFGFPFQEHVEEEDPNHQKPYYQRYPKYYPTQQQQQQQETTEPSCSNQEETQAPTVDGGACQKEEEQQEIEREKRPKKNIQPSNTVDLGQPQVPVDDRNQRSMSAPPTNERPRFVSSINIPVNQQPPPNVTPPQMSSQPQERVIPIHVEGRDEPIIPKKFAAQNAANSSHQPPQPQQPTGDKFFANRSPNFSQYFQRDQPFQNDWIPKGFHHTSKPSSHSNYATPSQRGRSPQPQPAKSEPSAAAAPPPPPTNVPKHAQKTAEEPKPPQEPPKTKNDPIDQIKSIQKDVSELMTQVDQFAGKPRDKQYLYLDEMLTRNLIKLDNIDTQGQENIRLARKEAIKCIEKCISILETKANSNVENKSEEKKMEVDKETTSEETINVTASSDVTTASSDSSTLPTEEKVDTNEKEEAMDTTPVETEGENLESKIEDKPAETTEPDKNMDVENKNDAVETNKNESGQNENEQEMEVNDTSDDKKEKKLKNKTEKK